MSERGRNILFLWNLKATAADKPVISDFQMKWNESGFRPLLCTYRLNWARRTSWGWWDDWYDTVLQTQDSKFEPWRSEAEHATSRSRRLPTILTFTRGWGRNICVSLKPPRPGTEPRTLAWKAAVLTTTLGPPPLRLSKQAALTTAPGPRPYVGLDVKYQSQRTTHTCASVFFCCVYMCCIFGPWKTDVDHNGSSLFSLSLLHLSIESKKISQICRTDNCRRHKLDCKIRSIFCHLKLWSALAIHKFGWKCYFIGQVTIRLTLTARE